MPLTLFFRALAVCTCLLLALPAWGADDETAPLSAPDAVSDDAGSLAEAQALMDAGRFMEAVAILGPLLQGQVIEANTLFLYGLAATGAAQQAGVPTTRGTYCWTRPSAPSTPFWSARRG